MSEGGPKLKDHFTDDYTKPKTPGKRESKIIIKNNFLGG